MYFQVQFVNVSAQEEVIYDDTRSYRMFKAHNGTNPEERGVPDSEACDWHKYECDKSCVGFGSVSAARMQQQAGVFT